MTVENTTAEAVEFTPRDVLASFNTVELFHSTSVFTLDFELDAFRFAENDDALLTLPFTVGAQRFDIEVETVRFSPATTLDEVTDHCLEFAASSMVDYEDGFEYHQRFLLQRTTAMARTNALVQHLGATFEAARFVGLYHTRVIRDQEEHEEGPLVAHATVIVLQHKDVVYAVVTDLANGLFDAKLENTIKALTLRSEISYDSEFRADALLLLGLTLATVLPDSATPFNDNQIAFVDDHVLMLASLEAMSAGNETGLQRAFNLLCERSALVGDDRLLMPVYREAVKISPQLTRSDFTPRINEQGTTYPTLWDLGSELDDEVLEDPFEALAQDFADDGDLEDQIQDFIDGDGATGLILVLPLAMWQGPMDFEELAAEVFAQEFGGEALFSLEDFSLGDACAMADRLLDAGAANNNRALAAVYYEPYLHYLIYNYPKLGGEDDIYTDTLDRPRFTDVGYAAVLRHLHARLGAATTGSTGHG